MGEGVPDGLRVLCAGDRFIGPALLADAVRAALGTDIDVREHASAWPDDPFADVDGVREAAGDPDDVAAAATDVDVLVTHLAPVTAEVIAAAGSRLRLIAVTRGGPVNVDLDAARRRRVPVANLPGRNLGAVAEFVVGTMIAGMRNVPAAAAQLADGRWDGSSYRYDRCGPELRAATVGLVGLGAVGSRVAELLRAFGADVVAHDPFASPDAAAGLGVRLVDLPELLATADVVSVHARLTDRTRGMLDAAAFAAMKPGAYLVNTARGELVDQTALAAALAEGRLAGAALDVFSPEPPAADDPLLRRDDVLATPHIAGASRQVAEESAARIATAARDYLATGRLEHCANPEVLEEQP